MEHKGGYDPPSEGYEASILPIGRLVHGAECANQTRVAGLEDQSLIIRPTPLTANYSKMSKNLVGTLGLEPRSPCSQSKWVSRYPTSRKSKGPGIFFRSPRPESHDAEIQAYGSNLGVRLPSMAICIAGLPKCVACCIEVSG